MFAGAIHLICHILRVSCQSKRDLINAFTHEQKEVSKPCHRAVTTIDAAGALHQGPRTRGPRIATFYCKIFMLKTEVNFLLFRVESTHIFFVHHFCLLLEVFCCNLLRAPF